MNKHPQFFLGSILGATGLLGIVSYFQFRRELQIAERRVKAQQNKIDTRFGDIYYGTQGVSSPVLVVHGAGGGFDQALHFAKNISHEFEWIAPSRFGYLGSTLPKDASPQTQADAYTALLDALEIERVPVIGLSAGGPSALQFALRYPERCSGLVMVSAISEAMIDVASNPEVMENLISALLANDWLIWLAMKLVNRKIIPPAGVPMQVIRSLNEEDTYWLQDLLKATLPIKQRRIGIVNDFSQIYKLAIFPQGQISAPTLIMHAKDDSLVSIKQARFCAELIPHANFIELQRGGHLLLSQRVRVRTEVEQFLRLVIRDT
ncbi:MAG: alpha/beta fold hydrolase [Anaerolineales bacterium]